eukprot:6175768-Pleurochrysis_carterae.AAC.3
MRHLPARLSFLELRIAVEQFGDAHDTAHDGPLGIPKKHTVLASPDEAVKHTVMGHFSEGRGLLLDLTSHCKKNNASS